MKTVLVVVIAAIVAAAAVGTAVLVSTGAFRAAGGKAGFHGYDVTFGESTLPEGTEWFVNLSDGSSFHGTGESIQFSETNGTYDYSTASSSKDYLGSSGTFTVSGAAVLETAAFLLIRYSIAMGAPSWSSTNPDYGTIVIAAVSGGLTTAMFGFSVITQSDSSVAVGTAAPSSCAWAKAGTAFTTSNCGAPTGNWYVVLFWTGNDSIANVYVNGGWQPGTPTTAIAAGSETLVVVGAESLLQSSGDTLNAGGTAPYIVSGTSGSF